MEVKPGQRWLLKSDDYHFVAEVIETKVFIQYKVVQFFKGSDDTCLNKIVTYNGKTFLTKYWTYLVNQDRA